MARKVLNKLWPPRNYKQLHKKEACGFFLFLLEDLESLSSSPKSPVKLTQIKVITSQQVVKIKIVANFSI